MQHYPIYLSTRGQKIVLSGGGEAVMAKLRLLLKTEADIHVFAQTPSAELYRLFYEDRLTLTARALQKGDVTGAALFYAADENPTEDARTAAIAKSEGALVNVVDNLEASGFITPAIVDRDPVTIAIGTEGAAPVLARQIKSQIEEILPSNLGLLARIGKTFRDAATALPFGKARRAFWSDFYTTTGPRALTKGPTEVTPALHDLLRQHLRRTEITGHVDFVGAGPGDPELLTLKARKALDHADVIIHDRLVAPEILELARREAVFVDVGKQGFATSTAQADINDLIVEHAQNGHHVVRLKGGDPVVFGRLDEELDALRGTDISYAIIPGITAASAAAAGMGQSLTRRGRNSGLRLLTGHDTQGFADHDWRQLAQPGQVAALYMSKKAARFVQGRLLMHSAVDATPVSIIENASRADQRVIGTTLSELDRCFTGAEIPGPAILIYGIAPRALSLTLTPKKEETA
ncbi:siroheme synthase CysG [Aestuariibius sp. HNIBRBA575]|uniref:siroheme synthase CysG n=1 Tax=Aestuariibius sp. HNIBRBA575 TaxID=3233343 RepID=UPI0034A25BEF